MAAELPSLPRKVYTDVYFLEKTQEDPRYSEPIRKISHKTGSKSCSPNGKREKGKERS